MLCAADISLMAYKNPKITLFLISGRSGGSGNFMGRGSNFGGGGNFGRGE